MKYGERFKRRKREAWLSTYEFDVNPDDWKMLRFEAYDRNWLQFVAKCRAGEDNSDYDLVIGGIASDQVIRTIERYFAGELSEDEASDCSNMRSPTISTASARSVCLTNV